MGTLKYAYDTVASGDQSKYPVSNNELTIKSFYEPDYDVALVLKNGSTTVKNVTLTLNRFAFGGNAGSLLLVDGNGTNCRQSWRNPDCREGNIFVSTSYLGLIDTFYSKGETTQINGFELSLQPTGENTSELRGNYYNNETVYKRNEDFNPWAVAIYYHDDEVVMTRSFNLGEDVKSFGFTTEAIPNEEVNNRAKTWDNDLQDYRILIILSNKQRCVWMRVSQSANQ